MATHVQPVDRMKMIAEGQMHSTVPPATYSGLPSATSLGAPIGGVPRAPSYDPDDKTHMKPNPAVNINQPTPHPFLKVTKVPVPPNLGPRCSAYVPCKPIHCAGCDDNECNNCFECQKEDCECPYPHEIAQGICDVANQYAYDWTEFVGREFNEEFCCMAVNDRSNPDCYYPIGCPKPNRDVRMCDGACPAGSSEGKLIAEGLLSWIHLPYFPAFHRPGWLFRYLIGPYDKDLAQIFISDLVAGLTVAMTLVPQALSYAGLAGMPKVNGLYAAILPSATYVFFGSSMQLAVGPVAIVSLLMGALMARYQPDFATNTVAAVDTGAQASLNCGIIMAGLAVINVGSFITFISYPVMSGFTTGAAMSIGLSQIKNAFGFPNQPTGCKGYTQIPNFEGPATTVPNPPQQGQTGYRYAYQIMQWYALNWNAKFEVNPAATAAQRTSCNNYLQGASRSVQNPIAISIAFGIFVPIVIINYFKANVFKATATRKKRWSYWTFNILVSLLPFLALITATSITQVFIKKGDSFDANTLNIVGLVPSGLNILRTPTLRQPFGPFFVDCIPLALILFMESYSVARRIASQNNELYLLNASQELWANGVANLLGSISSAFPVSGSFSRSALNFTVGAKTPFSKAICMFIILLVLSVLTPYFYFIPNSALSGIIWVAINSLVDFSDLWESWKHNKKDFFIMFMTLAITFITDTEVGLACGVGASVLFYLADLAFSAYTAPYAHFLSEQGVEEVELQGDMSFIQAGRFTYFVDGLLRTEPERPPDNAHPQTKALYEARSCFDSTFRPRALGGAIRDVLPTAIVFDFSGVNILDFSGQTAIVEAVYEARKLSVRIVIIKSRPHITYDLIKRGIYNDASTPDLNLDDYLYFSDLPTKNRDGSLYHVANKANELPQLYGKDDLEQRWTRQLPEYLSSPGPKAPKPPAGPPPPFDPVPPPFNPPVVTEPHAVPTNKSV